MAETKKRFLDVWITESNTVYREVPFLVVVDWIQQGRLVADDQLRWSGQAQWFRLGSNPAFAAYMPRSEPFRVEDQAEALERVEVDFAWKRRRDDDDDDVDMIPLIDVSLVLLIFFILTTTSVAATTNINTPFADKGELLGTKDMMWVGVDGKGDKAIYSIGWEDGRPAPGDDQLQSLGELINRVKAKLTDVDRKIKVNIQASRDIDSGEVRKVLIELQKLDQRRLIVNKFFGVSQRGD
jgi:biopolymer transport protein ExbD